VLQVDKGNKGEYCWWTKLTKCGFWDALWTQMGKSARNSVAVQTEDRNCWRGADKGHKFSVRTVSNVSQNNW